MHNIGIHDFGHSGHGSGMAKFDFERKWKISTSMK